MIVRYMEIRDMSGEEQIDLFETAHIKSGCSCRLNQKNWKLAFTPYAKAYKRIETLFSQLTDWSPPPFYQKLCEDNKRSVCRNYWENQCADNPNNMSIILMESLLVELNTH